MKISEAKAQYYRNSTILAANKSNMANRKEEVEKRYKETGNDSYLKEAATLELSIKNTEEAEKKNQSILDSINEQWMARMNMESAKQQGEAMAKGAEDMGKVITVFRRLASGDIVPASDEKKLMEYDWKMYQMAKNMQMMAQVEERKKHKSLWEDEEPTENADPNEVANESEYVGSLPEIEIPDVSETIMED